MKLCKLFFIYILLTSCQSQAFKQGEKLYNGYCASCHMEDGTGLGKVLPPIADSDYLQTNFAQLPCIIRHGLKDTILVNGNEYAQPMVGIKLLNEVEISNIINYINYKWYGNALPSQSLKAIKETLEECSE